MATLYLFAGLFFSFLVGALFSRRTSSAAGKVFDLTKKIDEKKAAEAKQQATADAKTKEYLDALDKYDPNFRDSNDDGSGH